MMIKNFLCLTALLVATSTSAQADFPFKQPKPSSPIEMPKGSEQSGTWTGYLIDTDNMKACALKIDPKDCLTSYSKEAALATKRPFLLYANNNWYALDKNGSKLARLYIEKTSQPKGFFVAIKGASLGHTITVENIEDAANFAVK